MEFKYVRFYGCQFGFSLIKKSTTHNILHNGLSLYTECPRTVCRCWIWITDKRLEIIQFRFLICKGDSLGFCLRPIPYISDHWSSHTANECPGGHFRIGRKNWRFGNTKHLRGIVLTSAVYEINRSGFLQHLQGGLYYNIQYVHTLWYVWFCLYVRHTFIPRLTTKSHCVL